MIAFKFLARGAVSPFTGFRWPGPGQWVDAPGERAEVWVHACHARDLAHWIDDELWRIELGGGVRETRYQVAAARGRLVQRVEGWTPALAAEYGRACALHARDVALPHLPPGLRDRLAAAADLEGVAAEVGAEGTPPRLAALVADAATWARLYGPASGSYAAATVALVAGGGVPAFEAERTWQAGWLAERLGLEAGADTVH